MRIALSAATALTVASLLAAGAPPDTARAGGDTELVATLSGANEVNGGDADGGGTAMITLKGRRKVCFDITVSNIALPATGAHIHDGEPGMNGPIVVRLTPAPDNSGHSQGCVRANRVVFLDIKNNPTKHYVNVHNGPFPDGAVRGQLSAS